MVDYSLEFGYGIIIDSDIEKEIENKINEDSIIDDFTDSFCRLINSWIGGDYFLGVTTRLNVETDNVYKIEDFEIPSKEVDEFLKFFDTYNLWDCIKWEPQKYLINFCY